VIFQKLQGCVCAWMHASMHACVWREKWVRVESKEWMKRPI